jgi:NAD(P)-dependent dehydrogenase (short-subunit alcohol dehydrogenase family)
LGLALAKLLVADGVEVVNVSRRKPPIDIHNIQAEFSNSADIKNAILEIEKKHPEFDALVNCV